MSEILCWEALDPAAAEVEDARRLYEATQPADERIPWEWIVGGVARRVSWRPGVWSPHLLVASDGGGIAGFCCGMSHPVWGGYLSYIGTQEGHRGRGIASRLVHLLVQVLRVDAAGTGEDVPFVVWESRPPRAGENPTPWVARLRLFAKAGAMWMRGVTFLAERYDGGAGAVPLQLFVMPVGSPVIDPAEVVRGLARLVYRLEEGHPLLLASMPGPGVELVPAGEAEGFRG